MITVRSSPRNSRVAAVTIALAVIAGAAPDAHRRDEYLQAARLAIDIDADRVQIELDLTPGIAVFDRVLSDIDLDANGAIDIDERRAYSQRVLSDITLAIDGMPLALAVIDSRFPATDTMRLGESAIRMNIAGTLPELGAGPHRVHYRNTHRSDIGAYLANALVPTSDRVIITNQQRDGDQHELIIDWALRPATATRSRLWLAGSAACVLVGLGVVWWRRSPA
jgi:hypothetical protein